MHRPRKMHQGHGRGKNLRTHQIQNGQTRRLWQLQIQGRRGDQVAPNYLIQVSTDARRIYQCYDRCILIPAIAATLLSYVDAIGCDDERRGGERILKASFLRKAHSPNNLNIPGRGSPVC